MTINMMKREQKHLAGGGGGRERTYTYIHISDDYMHQKTTAESSNANLTTDLAFKCTKLDKANISYKEEMFYFHRIAIICT